MRVVIAGMNGCLASGFIGLVDLFWLAQKAILGRTENAPWEIVTASSDGRAVTDGHGRKLLVDAAFQDIRNCDAVLVPGFVPDDNGCPPEMRGLANAARWLRNQHAQGALVCGSCSGVFLLGEAGLLNERRCTTTWWLHDEMKRRYPKADAAWGAAIIEDRRVISAGGPLSWIDLSLHVIRVFCGADAARLAADFAVIDTAPLSQAVYVPSGHVAAADPLVLAAEKIINDESVLESLGETAEGWKCQVSRPRKPGRMYRLNSWNSCTSVSAIPGCSTNIILAISAQPLETA